MINTPHHGMANFIGYTQNPTPSDKCKARDANHGAVQSNRSQSFQHPGCSGTDPDRAEAKLTHLFSWSTTHVDPAES